MTQYRSPHRASTGLHFAVVTTLLSLMMSNACSAAAASEQAIEQGHDLYEQYCASCHGPDLVTPSKLVFDLRQFPKDAGDRFKQSVMNGKGTGMPAWRDTLSPEDIASLWAYLRDADKR